MYKKQILNVIDVSLSAIKDLDELLQKDLLNPLYKRAFIRRICDLGEALTYFRKDDNATNPQLRANPLLKEVQDNHIDLVVAFTQARNYFLHDYVIDHYQGNEVEFNSNLEHFRNYSTSLKNALNIINLKNEVINGEFTYRKKNSPPVDTSKNTILKYAEYLDKEISELYDFIKKENINVAYIDIRPDSKYIKFALENYIENVFSLLKAYDRRLCGNPKYYNDDTIKNLFDNLGPRFQTFILEANQSRQDIAHELERNFDPHQIELSIYNIKIIQNEYIKPIINYLPSLFYKNFKNEINIDDINRQLIALQNFDNITKDEYKIKLTAARLAVINAYARSCIVDKSYINYLNFHNLDYYTEQDLTDTTMNFFHDLDEESNGIMAYLFPLNQQDYFLLKKEKYDEISLQIKNLATAVKNSQDISIKEILLTLQNKLNSYDNDIATFNEDMDYFNTLFSKSKEEISNGLKEKNINIKFNVPPHNWSLLHLAFYSNNKEAIECLIELGINPYICDDFGNDAISYIKADTDPDIKNILKKGKFLYDIQHPFYDTELNFFKQQIEAISASLSIEGLQSTSSALSNAETIVSPPEEHLNPTDYGPLFSQFTQPLDSTLAEQNIEKRGEKRLLPVEILSEKEIKKPKLDIDKDEGKPESSPPSPI